ncbi:MAG: hypothetical protein ACRDSP_10360 [Pseudonocardiaceae bacterium]
MLVAIGVVAAAATTAGCGGGVDKAQPCKNIQQEIQNLFQTSAKQINDPKALIGTLKDGATKIRNEGDPVGGDVKKAADEAGTALDQLADKMSHGTPTQADLDPLLKAGGNIKSACS